MEGVDAPLTQHEDEKAGGEQGSSTALQSVSCVYYGAGIV